MRKSQFSDEQQIAVVQQVATGSTIPEVCRKFGITETTFYRWRAKYDGVAASDARRLRTLEEENRRLKQLVADLSLDNAMLKDVVGRKW
jgi:putative transposase